MVDGVITNVVAFGAFVDIGSDSDALIHSSKMAKEGRSDRSNPV